MDAHTVGEKWAAYAKGLEVEVLNLRSQVKALEMKGGEWAALRARLEKDLEVCRELLTEKDGHIARAVKAVNDLKVSLAEANQRIVELQQPAPLPPEPEPVEPDPVPAEPADRHPIKGGSEAGPIGLHRGSASYDYAAAGIPDDLRAQLKAMPDYEVPTEAMCHWIVGFDGARSNDGARQFIPRNASGDVLGDVYRAHVAAGKPLPCRIGLKTANAGRFTPGGLYNVNDSSEVGGTVKVELVGLHPDAEVSLSWSGRHGYVEWLAAYNLFLRGRTDSFAIRAMDSCGTIIFDGCAVLEAPQVRAKWVNTPRSADYSSLSHIGFFENAVWANGDQRKTKDQGGISKVHEHLRYWKAARGGGLWQMHNYDIGGNRTASQVRPDGADYDHPASHAGFRGDIVFMGNRSDGWGWDHDYEGGGQLYTAWQCLDGNVAFLKNVATDLRYGGIGAMAQQDYRNVYGPKGRPIGKVHLFGNQMEGLRSKRSIVDVSGVDELHLWGGNVFHGPRGIVVDSEWSRRNTGILTGRIDYHAHDAGLMTWDAATGRHVSTTVGVLEAQGTLWEQSAQAEANRLAGANR